MITNDKNLNNIVIIKSLINMKNFIFENIILKKHQLIKSFIVGILWIMWIYLWFFHRSFILEPSPFGLWEYIFPIHYVISAFTLYSILYLPQNYNSNKISGRYLFKICFLQLINVFALFGVFAILDNSHINSPFEIPLLILILFFNLIIVWRAKYTQLKFWEKFKSTITLSVKNEDRIKENRIKLTIFVFSGVFLLNLSGFFFDDDLVYIVFTVTQIVFSVGYWLYVSENRKWIDRFYDFLALLGLNFFNLLLKYLVWSYLKDNFYSDTPIFILVLFLEFFQIYIYYSFSSRTYLVDFTLKLPKKPELFKESSINPTKIEQFFCEKCGNVIEQLDSFIHKENSSIFCPFCGEKIMRYELLDISEKELLIKHQKALEQLDHKSEPRSYLP